MDRTQILRFFYFVALLLITVRLFYWQVIKGEELQVMAENQHQKTSTLQAQRGSIYFSDGSILTTNKPTYILFGMPKVIKDPDFVAEKLTKILYDTPGINLKGEELVSYLQSTKKIKEVLSQDLYWVQIEKNISLDKKLAIEKEGLPGIGFENLVSRFYPEASSGAHLLGFVGSDSGGRPTGYFGVEGFYNGELKGSSGLITEEKDARGLPILSGKFFKREATPGHDLILNIDRTVQYIAEKKLKAGILKYGAKAGSIIILEPKTGKILALASYPNYDPGSFSSFPGDLYKNPVVADSYEPGSTFKVLVLAAALEEKLVESDTKCDICSGPVQVSGHTIRTWNSKYRPEATMTDVIVHSDNTGMVFISRKLGLDNMYRYIQDFGFGSLTQVDLQDETTPEIRNIDDWREIDLATSSFGQGIAVTSIQMVRAVAAIANGGSLMEPQIVKAVKTKDKMVEIKPKVTRQILSPETTKKVTQIMVEAVEKGESRVFAPKGFKIAGKTGTAQIPVAGHYDPDKTIASFVGFAPADDPKFVMLVRYTEPSSSIFGSETAAPTFFEVAKELFTYFRITPTE
ncbi:MAG: penicillin-binding protein 2 [Candidatus Daviesbacteria bacterium]|nr:penicillin-binding protein 2 [Candidatus Daviesbacteria bacterium]